jgi:hypothetical protein
VGVEVLGRDGLDEIAPSREDARRLRATDRLPAAERDEIRALVRESLEVRTRREFRGRVNDDRDAGSCAIVATSWSGGPVYDFSTYPTATVSSVMASAIPHGSVFGEPVPRCRSFVPTSTISAPAVRKAWS